MEQLGSRWTDFRDIWYWVYLGKTVEKINISLNSDNNNRYCTWRPIYVHLWQYIAQFFFEWEMFQTAVVQKIKTYILCSIFFFENHAVYDIMWKSIVQLDRPQMTIWRIACCIHKATNAHSQYVILIAFLLQQWLHVHTLLLRYIYVVHCLYWWEYIASVICEWKSMDHWWNESDWGEPQYLEKSLSQCHFVLYTSHIDWPEMKSGRRHTLWAATRPKWTAKDYYWLRRCALYWLSGQLLYLAVSTTGVRNEKFSKYSNTRRIKNSQVRVTYCEHLCDLGNARKVNANQMYLLPKNNSFLVTELKRSK